MHKGKKVVQRPLNPRQAMIQQMRREWLGKWVWFDPGDETDIQKGQVVLINHLGEVYVSYDFDERGCLTLDVCTIDDILQSLTLVDR